ncbi:hypothetical protein CQ12_38665 [Bradyrhizobium jicamae]|uniref:Uncharacterized protein n=1 Tax=Bradyrhizobium jicamae TaxID=280332 RepID=A0A0R3KI05_9BRAD|nr:hypothetical protein [Bradyrhizobium jicamae]KRQ95510.1 hypothetical protein CQ12_38665 [Bradyrhizobium jicamae]
MPNLKVVDGDWSDEIQWTTLCHANIIIINGEIKGDKATAFALRDKINKQIEAGLVRQPRRGWYQFKKVGPDPVDQ